MIKNITASCVFLLCLWANAIEFTGKVVGIADGDTITVLDASNAQHKIRLAEIDTPEKSQAFGSRAKQALSEKIFGKTVTIQYDTKDRYGRIVGTVMLGERRINMEMVAEGWAWHYKQYSKSDELAGAETAARKDKLGLWADKDPTPPWEYRRGEKTDRVVKPVTEVADAQVVAPGYWLNASSNVRHNQSCKYFKNTKSGRACSLTEGRPCGICGG